MRTLKSVADHLADCSPDVFRAKLAVVEKLYADWLTESSSSCVSSAVEQLGAGHHDTPCGSVDVQINEADLEEQLHDTRRDGIEEKRTSPVQVQDKPEENIATHEAYCSVNIQAASSCSNPRTPQLKLPLVKPRALLTGIVGETTSSRVLNCGYIIQEADVEVRPELLPSGLLDYRVQMRQLQHHFSEEARQLLTSAVSIKKKNELWLCHACQERDSGEIKMICCDHCLQWFHWTCAAVKQADAKKKLWFRRPCCDIV
ncbi:hypothetical protein MRX96_019488 [Rhipicephalus microplus]